MTEQIQDPSGCEGTVVSARAEANPADQIARQELIDAVRAGLASAGASWLECFETNPLLDAEVWTDRAVRAAAAEALRGAVDAWFAEPANQKKLWQWAAHWAAQHNYSKLATVCDPDDLIVAVLLRLKQTIENFEAATGHWDPARWEGAQETIEPTWFPVRERGFEAWVHDATIKETGRCLKDAATAPVLVAVDPGSKGVPVSGSRPHTIRPLPDPDSPGGAWFDDVRVRVAWFVGSDERVLSPDLAGLNEPARAEVVKGAALGAVGAVLEFLEGGTDKFPEVPSTCSAAVRAVDPRNPAPTRLVPDVAYTLSESLRWTFLQLKGEPFVPEPVKHATAVVFGQWRFAQLPMIAKSLFEALVANPNDMRRQARCTWAMELCHDLAYLHPDLRFGDRDDSRGESSLLGFVGTSPRLMTFVHQQAQKATQWLDGQATSDGTRFVRRELASVVAGVSDSNLGQVAGVPSPVRVQVAQTLVSFDQILTQFSTTHVL